jgi:hypothetical protein
MQHQAADFSRRVIAEVSRADTSELVYLLSVKAVNERIEAMSRALLFYCGLQG